MKKNCTVCDAEFETHHPLYKFCSQVCQKINTRQRDNNRYRKKNPLQEQKRTCNFCDIEFETLYPNQIKYCGDECRKQKKIQRGDIYRIENRQAMNQYSRDKRKKDKLNLPPEKKNCAICDAEFESNHPLYKTCSRACGKINTKREKALRYSEKQLLKPVMVKNCIVCDESFSPLNTSNVYCGEQCRTLASRKRLAALRGGWSKYNDQNSIKKCVECGDNFEQKSKQRVTCYNSTCHSNRKKRLLKNRNSEPRQAISRRIRRSINQCIRHKKIVKSDKSFDMLGYTPKELMDHFESYFTEESGYTWDNMHLWHIDHIRPIASFDFDSTDHPEFKECWALENLQPLWAKDNMRKNAIWNGVDYRRVKA